MMSFPAFGSSPKVRGHKRNQGGVHKTRVADRALQLALVAKRRRKAARTTDATEATGLGVRK
jgi:hypothetical protein